MARQYIIQNYSGAIEWPDNLSFKTTVVPLSGQTIYIIIQNYIGAIEWPDIRRVNSTFVLYHFYLYLLCHAEILSFHLFYTFSAQAKTKKPSKDYKKQQGITKTNSSQTQEKYWKWQTPNQKEGPSKEEKEGKEDP